MFREFGQRCQVRGRLDVSAVTYTKRVFAVRWLVRIGVAALVVGGLITAEVFQISRDWLNGHLNQVSLTITALALLVAAYAAEQARITVIQATRYRDIDRLETIRDRVEKLIPAANSVTLGAELSRFGENELPQCWALDGTLPVAAGDVLDTFLVLEAQKELTEKLKSLRKRVP